MANNADVSTRRRVKLYMLNEERQWDDKGTGHVSATLIESNSMALVVISETDGSHLLESRIQHDTAYQKQQETLIVWSEGENIDLALSFQEKTGCDDIWEKICNVQGKDPSVEITQDLIDEADEGDDIEDTNASSGNNAGFEFPTCDLAHLSDISEMFSQVTNYPIQRERIASALERSQYLKQLIDLFHKAEDLEDQRSLNYLYEITRAIIQFNRRTLYEMIFSDEYLMDIVGMLEYNPTKRVKHREFITNISNYKEIIPLNSMLKNKIHQTYRVQYIQDNCLPPPSLFDDNAGSSLNSFIYLNKIDIITRLQEDTQFLQQLFGNLLLPETSLENRLDLLGLLKEFCTIVNALQPAQKETFFNSLCQNRALRSIFYSFKNVNESVKAICVDILQIFVENQASVVREFFISDSRENSGEFLYLNILIDHLINDVDSELSTGFLIMNMLKLLLDPENMINSGQRNEKQEFLNFFYRNCMQHLTRPLEELTMDNELKYDDYHTAMVMHDLVELLAFCVEFHSYHMKNYAYHYHTLLRVVTLFKSQHKFVVLAALRVIRKFIACKEELNYRYIIRNNILQDIILLLDNNREYNMLNSAILELFEFIKLENINSLINHIIENYWDILQHHNYVTIFNTLKTRYDQSMERHMKSSGVGGGGQISTPSTVSSTLNMLSVINPSVGSNNQVNHIHHNNRMRREARALEDDEEQWYDQDDEDDDDMINNTTSASSNQVFSSSATFIERFTSNSRSSFNDNSTPSELKDNDEENDTLVQFKSANNNRYLRDQQQIAINIKSTNLTLGNVSSTTTSSIENGGSGDTLQFNNTSSVDIDINDIVDNSTTLPADNSNVTTSNLTNNSSLCHNSDVIEIEPQNITSSNIDKGASDTTETSLLTGLVDYDDDDDEGEDEVVNDNTVVNVQPNPQNITTDLTSSECSINALSNTNCNKDLASSTDLVTPSVANDWNYTSVSSPKRMKLE